MCLVGRIVSREAEILPVPVGLDLIKSVLLGCCVRITPEQQPQGRLGERGNVQKDRRCLRRISRLSTVIAFLEANSRTNGGVILWAAFTELGGGPGKICAKAARFKDRDLDAEQSDLFGQRL